MTTGIQSNVPYPNYPYNAVGATPTTKDIASTCYDSQRPAVARTYEYLITEDDTSYTWPVIGAVVSAIAFVTVGGMRGRAACNAVKSALSSTGSRIASGASSVFSGIKSLPSKIASLFRRRP